MFDTILIGSGPPALLHGLSRSQTGESIAFIDRGSRLGGAWKPTSIFGSEHVETGVHLLENRTHLNAALETLLGSDQLAVADGDFGMVGSFRMPMKYCRILLYLLVTSKSLLKGNIEKARYALSKLAAAVKEFPTPFLYPRQGFRAVLEALERLLTASKAQFIFGEDVTSVRILPSAVEVTTNRANYTSRRIVMSSRAHAPIAGCEDIWRAQRFVAIPHLMLQLEDACPAFGGYVEFLGSSFLKRVRNVGNLQSQEVRVSRSIIAAQLRQAPDGQAIGRTVDAARKQLIDLRLISESSVVADFAFKAHQYSEMPSQALKELGLRYPQQLHILRTKDLSDETHSIVLR